MAAIRVRQALRTGVAGRNSAEVMSGVVILGAFLCASAAAMAASGAHGQAAFGRALLELLIVGVPILAGVYSLRAPINARFGIALLIIGFTWSLTALGESSLSVPYTVGRLATWLIVPGVVYLLVAFPDGQVAPGLDRLLVCSAIALAVVLFLGTAPLVRAYPPHTVWATCTTNCPANALSVLDHQPAFIARLIQIREWLVDLLWIGLFLSMLRRWLEASPLQRVAMGPAFVAGATAGLCHIAFYAARQLGAPAGTVVALSWAWTVCIVILCAAFLFGLFWRRMLLAGAMARLTEALRDDVDAPHVREALAAALSDPTVELLIRDEGSCEWHDTHGHTVPARHLSRRGRAATAIGGEPDATSVILIHDVALRDDDELMSGVTALVLAGLRQEQLLLDRTRAMAEVENSRRRIAETADVERARIERDLHDGAQQRLIGLRIRLDEAEEKLHADPVGAADTLRKLGREVDKALEDLRTLARGVYPMVLRDRGLEDALRAIARESPIPVHIASAGVTRYPLEIESAIYFVCVEALQNAMKHASTATGVWIKLAHNHALRFEIRDDGPGFVPDTQRHRGLRNMQDRIEAIGGHLVVDAGRGNGTRVLGCIDTPEVGLTTDRG
jgi:signal transduction histidine kinase